LQIFSVDPANTLTRSRELRPRRMERWAEGTARRLTAGLGVASDDRTSRTEFRRDLAGRRIHIIGNSTNPIENLNGSIAHYARNVKRWKSGQMTLRWVASAFSDAAGRFRKLKGFSDMKSLLSALNQRAPLDLANNELKAA